MSASWCHSVVFRFIAYPFLLLLCQWKEEDQVNQQCERYWLKHHHFLYCVWMTVTTNLEAMHEYVWMSICVYSLKEIRKKKSEREREKSESEWKEVVCPSHAHFFFFLFVLLKVWCYLGFKWPLFIVFLNVNAHIFKCCWRQSIGNCPVCWSMIWACACGRAKGASLTLAYTQTHTWHVWYRKNHLNNGKFAWKTD